MSTTIDSRVVELKFDNEQFEKAVTASQSSLDNLNKTIDNACSQTKSSLTGFQNALGSSGIASAAETINEKFSALGVVGTTVLAKLTSSVYDLAANGLSKLSSTITGIYDKISSGGKTRASNIEQAKYQLAGLSIAWEDVSDSISTAVNDTAYGMDAAAKAAGQLAASGVSVGDQMTKTLSAISGIASQTNSEYDDIATVIERVAGQGRVMATDLNSLAARGLNVAADIATNMGITESEVREMVSDGEIGLDDLVDATYKYYENAKRANTTVSGITRNITAAMSQLGEKFWAPIVQNMDETNDKVYALVDLLNQVRYIFKGLKSAVTSSGVLDSSLVETWTKWVGVFFKWATEAVELITGGEEMFKNSQAMEWMQNISDGLNIILDGIAQAVTLWRTFDDIGATAGDGTYYLLSVTESLLYVITAVSEKFRNFAATIDFTFIAKGLRNIYYIGQEIVDMVRQFASGISEVGAVSKILEGLNFVVGRFTTYLEDAWAVSERNLSIFKDIGHVIGNLINIVIDLGEAFVNTFLNRFKFTNWDFFDPVTEGASRLSDALAGLLTNSGAVASIFDGLWASVDLLLTPLKLLYNLITGSVSQLSFEGIGTGAKSIIDVVANLSEKVVALDDAVNEWLTGVYTKINKLTSKIKPAIAKVKSLLSELAANITKTCAPAIDKLKDAFANIDRTKITATLNNVKEAFTNLYTKIKPYLDEIGEWITNKIANFELPDWLLSMLGITKASAAGAEGMDATATSMEDVAEESEKTKTIWDKISDFMGNAKEKLSGISDALPEINFKSEHIQNATQTIKDLIDSIPFDLLGKLALLGTGIWALKEMATMADNIKQTVKAFTGMTNVVKTFTGLDLGKFSNFVKDITYAVKFGIYAKGILDIAKAMAALADIPAKDLVKAGVACGTVAVALAAAIKYLGYSATEYENIKAGAMILELVGLAISLKLFGKAMEEFAGFSWDDILHSIVSIGMVLGALKLITTVDMFGANSFQIKELLALSALIWVTAESLAKLAEIDQAKLTQAAGNLFSVLLVVALLAKMVIPAFMKFTKTGDQINSVSVNILGKMAGLAAVLIGIASILATVAVLTRVFEKSKPSSIALALGTMVVIIGAMIGVVVAMSKFPSFSFNTAGLIIFASSVALLAATVAGLAKVFETTSAGAIVGACATLIAIMAAMTAVMYAMTKMPVLATAKMTGLLVFAASVSALALVMRVLAKTFDQVAPSSAALAMAAVVVIVGAMCAAMLALGKMPDMTIKTTALIAFAAALGVMAIVLYAVDQIIANSSNPVASMVTLGVLAAALIGAMVAINAIGKNDKGSLAKVLTALGVFAAVIAVMVGLLYAIEQIAKDDRFVTACVTLGVIAVALVAALAAFGAIGTALGGGLAAVGAFLVAFGAGMVLLAASILVLGKAIAAIGDGIKTFVQDMADMANIDPSSIALGISNAITGILTGLATGIVNSGAAIVTALSNLIVAMCEAIQNALPAIINAAVLIIEAICTGITTALPTLCNTLIIVVTTLCQTILEMAPILIQTALSVLGELMMDVANFFVGPQALYVVECAKEFVINAIQSVVDLLEYLWPGVTGNLGDKLDAASQDIEGKKEQYRSAAEEATSGITEGITDEVDSINSDGSLTNSMSTIGDDLVAGLDTGITNGDWGSITSMISSKLGESGGILSTFRSVLGINSPSTITKGYGDNVIEGLKLGIEGNDILGIVTKKTSAILKSFTNKLTNTSLYSTGANVMKGLSSGISSLANSLYSKASSICSNLVSKMKGALGVHSPSTYMIEAGEYVDMGLMLGLVNMATQVNKTATSVASDAMQALTDTLYQETEDITEDGLSPVITPQLDLSDFNNGKKDIELDDATLKVGRIAANYEKQANNQNADLTGQSGGDTYNINFTQTNNSPEALDAVAIYRQTKSAIGRVQGVIR